MSTTKKYLEAFEKNPSVMTTGFRCAHCGEWHITNAKIYLTKACIKRGMLKKARR